MVKLQYITFFIALFSLAGACEKLKLKKKNPKTPDKAHIIDLEKPGYLDRADQRRKMSVHFYATVNAFCEIRFWAIDPQKSPTQADPTVQLCENKSGKTDLSLLVDGLNPDIIYRFELNAWPADQDKGAAGVFVVDELPGGHTNFGKKFEVREGELDELIVVGVNLPLGSASLHRHHMEKPVSLDSVRAGFKQSVGCKNTEDEAKPFASEEDNIRVESIAVRGFSTGVGVPWSDRNDRIRVDFQKDIQKSDQWEWNYRYLNDTYSFRIEAPSLLNSPHIESDDVRILDSVNLDTQKKMHSLTLQSGLPLKLSWNATKLSADSYVHVQLGHSSLAETVYCTFDAKSGSAELTAAQMDKLPQGSHFLLISLENSILKEFRERPVPSWLFRTHDWRAMRIEKTL